MVTFCPQLLLYPQLCPQSTYCIHIDSGKCRGREVTNQASVCIIAGANTESSRDGRSSNKLATTAICWVIFPSPVEDHIL